MDIFETFCFTLLAIPCNMTTVGNVASFDTSAPTVWKLYSYLYTAVSTTTRIRFSSATDQSNKDWYVDNVSVMVNGGAATNLLTNGNFESGAAVGWKIFSCASTCSASIKTSTSCLSGSGWCYNNDCTPSSNIQFLEQYFTTTVGATYNFTFWALKGGSGVGSGTAMYVNIL